MVEINLSFRSYYERMNSHNAMQYSLMKVKRVSKPFISLVGFDYDYDFIEL